MDVSVVIVNFNTFELTSNCIKSIIAFEACLDIEIIVVDNASTECNPEDFRVMYPQIELIKSSQNGGFAKGNNLGIDVSKGEYILLLNSDTVLYNNAIKEAHSIIEKDKSIGVLSGACLYPDLRPQPVAGRFPSIIREIRELCRVNKLLRGNKRKKYFLGEEWDYTQPVDADWVWGAFFMFKKSDLAQFPNGKLHDTFFMYGEDVQWCYHFKKVLKKKIFYHPAPQIIHYIGGSDKQQNDLIEKYISRILPNESKWLRLTRGVFYAKMYYFLKAMLYLSLRGTDNIKMANNYLRLMK